MAAGLLEILCHKSESDFLRDHEVGSEIPAALNSATRRPRCSLAAVLTRGLDCDGGYFLCKGPWRIIDIYLGFEVGWMSVKNRKKIGKMGGFCALQPFHWRTSGNQTHHKHER